MSEFDINERNTENEEVFPETEKPEESAAEEAAPSSEAVYYETPAQDGRYTADPTPQVNPASPPYMNSYTPYQPQPQASRGYYRPDTNEYVYSPQPPKKKGSGGKVFLAVVVGLLAVFVVSVASASAVNFFKMITDGSFVPGAVSDNDGDDDADTDKDKDKDGDNHITPDKSDGDVAKPAVTEPVVIRDYPGIEQLAAPADAMSLPDIYEKVSPSVVGVSCSVKGGTQTGTGFVISENGYIVTNAHVIDGYISVMIVDSDLNEYEAEVIGSDSQTDIAVLKIDPEGQNLVPVEFGISGELRIGELAIAIGNPLGFDLYGTMTTGIISGLNRTVTIGDNTMNLLQTSATINPGNSGGPLIDAYGRVIGITSAKVDTTYGENLGFAIPIDEAIPIVESLIKYGYVPGRPSLGIFSSQDITSLFSHYYRLPEGVYVLAVTPDSGAEKAGIRAGDVIIGIEGESVTSMEELTAIKNRYSVGDTVTLTIYRNGQNFDVDVVLTETTPENSVYPGE